MKKISKTELQELIAKPFFDLNQEEALILIKYHKRAVLKIEITFILVLLMLIAEITFTCLSYLKFDILCVSTCLFFLVLLYQLWFSGDPHSVKLFFLELVFTDKMQKKE
jgi:hypothetical protein